MVEFNGVKVPEGGKIYVVTITTSNGKTTTRIDPALEGPVNCPHVTGELRLG